MYKLKLAEEADLLAIRVMALRFQASSPYKNIPIDISEVDSFIRSFILGNKEEKVAILAVSPEGKYLGMVAGHAVKSYFSKDKVAAEVVWWVEPEHRNSRVSLALLDAFEFWAKKIGCSITQLSCLQNEETERIKRFYSRRGYAEAEISFMKGI